MKRVAISLVVIGMLSLTATLALAHAFPEHSTPGAGDTLSQSPPQVSVLFDTGLEPAFSHLEVKNAKGEVVSKKSHVASDNTKRLVAALPALAAGRYHVYWQVVARDTHRTVGDYTFSINP